MQERTEVMWSYFTGLAPVGETFEYPRSIVMNDCGFRDNSEYYRHLNRLIAAGVVKRLAAAHARSTGLLVVEQRHQSQLESKVN